MISNDIHPEKAPAAAIDTNKKLEIQLYTKEGVPILNCARKGGGYFELDKQNFVKEVTPPLLRN